MAQFVINVREIEEGVSEHQFSIPLDWLERELEGCEGLGAGDQPGSVELIATKRGREVLIRGFAKATFSVTCVRCLEDYRLPLEAEIEVLMLPGRAPAQGGDGAADKDDDELSVERYQGDQIELDGLIRDSLILEVPMNPNCGEECPGWDHLVSDTGKVC